MSNDVGISLDDDVDWVEELQSKVFEECLVEALSQKTRNKVTSSDENGSSSSSSLSSFTELKITKTAPISVINNCIHRSFAQIPHFRKSQGNEFLEELRQSLRRKVRDEERVCWREFRDTSKLWFLDLVNAVRQHSSSNNNNNNKNNDLNDVCSTNHSDAPTSTEASDRDVHSAGEHSDDDNQFTSSNPNDAMATCYNYNNSSPGLGTSDSVTEYLDDLDQVVDDISVDLQIRMKRCNEETTSLKAELLRTEEIISNLETDLKTKQVNIERISKKYTKLQIELEDHKDLLAKSEKREETCKQQLRALEKSYNSLQKQFANLEKKYEDIVSLKAKIDELSKLNAQYNKQIIEYKNKYDEKQLECDCLKEKYNELKKNYTELEQSHEKIVRKNLEKIDELHNELQHKVNNSSYFSCSQLSTTPPSYIGTYIHSTPHSNKKLSCHDSLYTELKASGFNVEESKIHELKEELTFYNDEIAWISEQIEKVLQEIAASRNEICVPSVQLVETNGIQSLKHKIATLVNTLRSCIAAVAKEPPALSSSQHQLMGEASQEKPDVLPKKGGYVFNDRDFASDKAENDLIATASVAPLIIINGYRPGAISPQLPDISGILKLDASDDDKENDQPEVIIPIKEALKRISELNDDDLPDGLPVPDIKQKSIFTTTNKPNWSDMIADLRSKREQINDATFCVKPKIGGSSGDDDKSNMKTFKKTNESIAKESGTTSPVSTPVPKLDTRFFTMTRPNYATVINDKVTTTSQNSSFDEIRSEIPCFRTPYADNPKPGPKRKLSVYNRSFDIDSLQVTPDNGKEQAHCVAAGTSEKKRSVSTPEAQEIIEALRAKQQQQQASSSSSSSTFVDQMTSYRCPKSSADLSLEDNILITKLDNSLASDLEDGAFVGAAGDGARKGFDKPIIIAPPKLKLADKLANKPVKTFKELDFTPNVGKGILAKSTPLQHSRIISSSVDLIKKEENNVKIEMSTINLANNTQDGNLSDLKSSSVVDGSGANKSWNTSISTSLLNNQICEKGGVKKGADDDDKTSMTPTTTTTTTRNPTNHSAAANDRALGTIFREDCKNSAAVVDVAMSSVSTLPVSVGRAMSSGEDSSAESECDAARKNVAADNVVVVVVVEESTQSKIETDNEAKKEKTDRTIIGENEKYEEDKVKTSPIIMNGKDKNVDGKKTATTNTTTSEIIDNNGNPKAFPSWTDEKLRESGIESFSDISSELSENISEEQLKKKCTNFSIGLSADRMTLSRRMDLAVRRRDQSELNFRNEVDRMQSDIMELASLCVDSESLERVERVKTQLEMVSRSSKWISSSAETLGAVRQERRVSRAVMLADKYLHVLRSKCEKLASELAETKRILAENNIVIEENLNELDDMPRIRYRAVPNNNRTMMARRRASIATISRPLLGSNQDLSKETPRQRNSVSGRAPGVRRPSLCFETPKREIEKLDRTDSNSTSELQEIFEQAESRRQSREENNNLIRSSVNNVTIITHNEHGEEQVEEVWPDLNEETVPNFDNSVINSFESRQRLRYPLICWLLSQYITWKPMIWGMFIAFFFGIFVKHVVSSMNHNGPPLSWWSLEEILSQYVQVENVGPRAI